MLFYKLYTSEKVNPVRNSSRCDSKPSGALNPAGIIIKPNPSAEQRGIISNGVKDGAKSWTLTQRDLTMIGILSSFPKPGDPHWHFAHVLLILLAKTRKQESFFVARDVMQEPDYNKPD